MLPTYIFILPPFRLEYLHVFVNVINFEYAFTENVLRCITVKTRREINEKKTIIFLEIFEVS